MTPLPALSELRDRPVTVMGLGRFGGGLGAVRFLCAHGARVTLTDRSSAEDLADSLAAVADLPLTRCRLGEHHPDDFTGARLVVASPAVPPQHPLLQLARKAGAVVTTEVALLWQSQPGRIVAVTGSNGKSTTSALMAAVMQAAGWCVRAGGNLGGSLLDQLSAMTPRDWLVLELSSFQLEYLEPLQPRPAAAVVTNFTPNHLDRHGTLEEYRRAKQILLTSLGSDSVAVLNADDPDVRQWQTRARRLWFDQTTDLPVELQAELNGRGEHFLANARAVTVTARALGIDDEAIVRGLRAFRGLPHRLEVVHQGEGITWIDDSAATTPESTLAALKTVKGPLAVIVGGADKGIDLQPLVAALASRAESVACIGHTAAELHRRLGEVQRNSPVPSDGPAVFQADTLEAAVAWCRRLSTRPLTVLLSPAAASFGLFRNFVERGQRFRALASGAVAGPDRNVDVVSVDECS